MALTYVVVSREVKFCFCFFFFIFQVNVIIAWEAGYLTEHFGFTFRTKAC